MAPKSAFKRRKTPVKPVTKALPAAKKPDEKMAQDKAATKIQSSFRGRQARNQVAAKKGNKKFQAELEEMQQLFDAAHDGTDNARWQYRVSAVVKEVMPKLESGTPADVAEARFRVLRIAEERIADRLEGHDRALAKTLKRLFEAQKEAVQRIRAAISKAADEKSEDRQAEQRRKEPEKKPQEEEEEEEEAATVSISAEALSANAGGITAFATAARLAAQPGGREILASQNHFWDDDEDDEDGESEERQEEEGTTEEEEPRIIRRHMHASLPRHLRLGWKPKFYAKIHMDDSKGRNRKLDPRRPQEELKLKKLKDLINLVYQAKHVADCQAAENDEPKETMSNFLFGYFRSKYQSRSVVEEWLNEIKRGIEKFSREEPEIKVFGKILENELPESFPEVQEQLSKSTLSILRRNLEDSNSEMSQSEISSIWDDWERQGVPMQAVKEVVRFMYSSKDQRDILEDLRELSEKPQPAGPMEAELKKGCIHLNDFLEVLKNFQLELADKYLVDFIRMFREVDVNGNGMINVVQLQDLVRRTGHVRVTPGTHAAIALDAARMAATAAAKNVRVCTFSEAVDLCNKLISARMRAKQA